jgi:cytochrome oxidase assembly protein ShyY1
MESRMGSLEVTLRGSWRTTLTIVLTFFGITMTIVFGMWVQLNARAERNYQIATDAMQTSQTVRQLQEERMQNDMEWRKLLLARLDAMNRQSEK